MPVYATLEWERPYPIAWGNVIVELLNATTGDPYPVPAGATLTVRGSDGVAVTDYDFSLGLWRNGFFALVETGQTLILHATIPPGKNIIEGDHQTATGAGIILTFANDGRVISSGSTLM